MKKVVYISALLALLCSCGMPESADYKSIEDTEIITLDPKELGITSEMISSEEPISEEIWNSTVPAVSENSVQIKISNTHENAGSNTEKIFIYFGSNIRIPLHQSFQKGYTIKWVWNNTYLTSLKIPQDSWDRISLQTDHTDGLLITEVQIQHSSELILNTSMLNSYPKTGKWLDYPKYKSINLQSEIWYTKRSRIANRPPNKIVGYALEELGKTDGCKYGAKDCNKNWCSEYASWCYRRLGMQTPSGNITNGVESMKKYFRNNRRLRYRSDILSKSYIPSMGDYMAVGNNSHSVVFVEWIDSINTITNATRFRVINGSNSQAVRLSTYQVGDVDAVGDYDYFTPPSPPTCSTTTCPVFPGQQGLNCCIGYKCCDGFCTMAPNCP